MSSLDLEISFSYGWCQFSASIGCGKVVIGNHWLNDKFAELVRCVKLLLDGHESVSCRWQGEVEEGHFIDLVADPNGGVSVAVHKFRYAGASDFSEIWSAARGELIFVAHLPLKEFVIAFAGALRRVRSTLVDSTGLITQFPRPFPQTDFELIEERATKMGYKPQSLSDMKGQ